MSKPPPWLTDGDVEEAKELLQKAARAIRGNDHEDALWALWDVLALLMGEDSETVVSA